MLVKFEIIKGDDMFEENVNKKGILNYSFVLAIVVIMVAMLVVGMSIHSKTTVKNTNEYKYSYNQYWMPFPTASASQPHQGGTKHYYVTYGFSVSGGGGNDNTIN